VASSLQSRFPIWMVVVAAAILSGVVVWALFRFGFVVQLVVLFALFFGSVLYKGRAKNKS
jgi:hypothetical protein